jgi:hypothetical protein
MSVKFTMCRKHKLPADIPQKYAVSNDVGISYCRSMHRCNVQCGGSFSTTQSKQPNGAWFWTKLGDWHACQKNCSQLHGFEDETHVSRCCHVRKESTSNVTKASKHLLCSQNHNILISHILSQLCISKDRLTKDNLLHVLQSKFE